VDVAIAKFANPLPLERQVRQMARDGLAVDSSTLWEQTWFLSQHLMETYEANQASPEERLATLATLRAKRSKPVVDKIRTWLMTQRALPRSSLGKAIAYTSGLWPGLVRFLADPKIPLDTNGAERALRGVAVGRKNHCGSRSERGTRVAALFYSLIESAKLCGVEPHAYLREAALRAVRNPGTVTLTRDIKSPEA
jgi:transposase